MQRTDQQLFCSIFSVLLAATIFFASGCDSKSSRGSSASLIGETVFGFTGEARQFIVPAGVTSITINAFGARGGDGWNAVGEGSVGGMGGLGGNVQATLAVTPGETLCIYVGGAGTDGTPTDDVRPAPGTGGWNGGGEGQVSGEGSVGGGGGGASDIRREAPGANPPRKCLDSNDPPELDDRILVAGGGGSGSGFCSSGAGNGGHGGDTVGGDGELCDASQDIQGQCDAMPGLSVGGEIGLRPPFNFDARIAAPVPTTTATSSCAAEDQGGVDNILLSITNRSGQDFIELYYVANPETTITNFDGLINGNAAFKIDDVGSNTPLVSESITSDNIFEAGETWEIILQDYSNTLGLLASKLASIGIPSGLANYSSGSIIGIVLGNGGTDTAGGWIGGDFGIGSTQAEAAKFPKNPGPELPFFPRASGAGGGGWYGGGTTDGSGGAGGSSYVTAVGSSAITHQQGVRDGNGLIVIGTN
jgi:hypothetical protein